MEKFELLSQVNFMKTCNLGIMMLNMPCVCQICQMQFQVLSNYQHPASHSFEIQTTCYFCQLLACNTHTHTLSSRSKSKFWMLVTYQVFCKTEKCVISFCPNLSSRIQADLFKLKDNLQLPNHVCLWSQSSTLKVDVCSGLVCKLNSGTISKYLALYMFERKIIGNSNLANNVMSLIPRYTALARLTDYLNNENNENGIFKNFLVFSI